MRIDMKQERLNVPADGCRGRGHGAQCREGQEALGLFGSYELAEGGVVLRHERRRFLCALCFDALALGWEDTRGWEQEGSVDRDERDDFL